MAEYLQRQAFHQVEVFLGGNAPAAVAPALQQEHIVGIEMRAHAAAGHGVAHHQVVEAGAGNESELLQQRRAAGQVMVQRLHQQGPVAPGQFFEVGLLERPVAKRPFPGLAHQPRFHVFAAGEFHHLGGGEQAGKAGDGVAHQQGLLVPVIAQELADGQPAE